MTYVRLITETDFYYKCMCLDFSEIQSAYFLSWFELVCPISMSSISMLLKVSSWSFESIIILQFVF